jgi:hypothetical protein
LRRYPFFFLSQSIRIAIVCFAFAALIFLIHFDGTKWLTGQQHARPGLFVMEDQDIQGIAVRSLRTRDEAPIESIG